MNPPTPRQPTRLVPFVFGFTVALAVGVPATLFVLAFLADNVTALVASVIGALIAIGTLGAAAYLLRHRLFKWVQDRGVDSLQEIYLPLTEAARAAKVGDTAAAFAELEKAGAVGVAFWGWLLVRRWILRILLGLAAAFAGLVGSALLFQQNALIKEQNAYWQEQNTRLQGQIELQAGADLRAQRSAYVATLFDELPSCVAGGGDRARCPRRASLRARSEVAEALVLLDRGQHACSRADALPATLAARSADCPRPDLRRVDLAKGALEGVDLRWANLERSRFEDAEMPRAMLEGAVLDGARLARVDLAKAQLQGASLVGAKLTRATLQGANLRGADLRRSAMTGADLADTDLRDVQWAGADLSEASLSGARVGPDWAADAKAATGLDLKDWQVCADGRLAASNTGCKE